MLQKKIHKNLKNLLKTHNNLISKTSKNKQKV